ncbi:uncharacterized protein B0H18DRAFT_903868, partial [Fomitopsis serialis]|uniref:uncharacterized protein n=1 Tax=Fomitopsis serialis TaxID=139415 RepID=UPI00200865A8
MAARDDVERVKLPSQSKKLKLRQLGVYALILCFLQETWSKSVQLVADTAPADAGEPFVAVNIPSYSNILVDGLRYGAYDTHRGRNSCYAYIDGRVPVRITHIFHVRHSRRDRSLAALECTCAVVQRFVYDEDIPDMPWATRATDLGINTWRAESLAAPEVVEVNRFSGHFALAVVPHREQELWVTMSLCHDTQEPDILDDAEEPGEAPERLEAAAG